MGRFFFQLLLLMGTVQSFHPITKTSSRISLQSSRLNSEAPRISQQSTQLNSAAPRTGTKRYAPKNEERRSHYSPVKRRLRQLPGELYGNYSDAILAKQDIYSVLNLAKSGKADAALTLFDRLISGGECVIRKKECNLLIKELGDAGHLDHCDEVLAIMKSVNIEPTLITYSTLISRAGSWLKLPRVEAYYNAMIAASIVPDVQCYNSLINAYSKMGYLDQAIALIDEMRSHGIHPTVVTYNTIIGSYARVGDTKQILTMLREMKTATPPVLPNQRTYSSLAQSYCFHDQVDVAYDLIRQMEREQQQVSDVTYSMLLHRYCLSSIDYVPIIDCLVIVLVALVT